MSLDNFDTSHWLLKDKEWVVQRKQDWLRIESYFQGPAHKAKKAKTIIKRYFLKGDLPDFKALKDWQSDERHLDIFCFLWLHPSWDKELLIKLRNDYASHLDVLKDDVVEGVSKIFMYGTIMASQNYGNEKVGDSDVLQTDGHNRLLFEILIADEKFNEFLSNGRDDWDILFNQKEFSSIITMTNWLKHEKLNNVNQDCLYQYENYLVYWANECSINTRYFEKKMWPREKPYIQNALVRLVDFDTDKEGDSPRTRSVLKLREIMENYDFHPDVTEMWAKAKAGTLETKGDPWK